ncbi:MAG: hypothetical protein WC789_01200 [Lentisphaeria bacterium]|jgi:hypothetical protein
MRIRLAVIPPDDLADVIRLTGHLRNAVNAGDMDVVEAATEELLAMTAKTRSVDISESEWRSFLAEVRSNNAAFQSDYVVPGNLCSQFFPGETTDAMILQLPFAEREGDDV